MNYIDGFVAAVPNANKAAYQSHCQQMGAVFREHGALAVVDAWGDDVPEGKLTSFPMAVKREPDESVVFGWIVWPSRQVRDAAWTAVMADPRMQDQSMPFDGKRMIYGGFQTIAQS
jgi:uncharacterized protein YbaA (DUF1428 family)